MDNEKIIGEILQGQQAARILITANQLNLFDAVADQPLSAETLAEKLSLSGKGTERMLNALCALGFLEKKDGAFQLLDSWRSHLTEDGSHSMKQWINLSADLAPVWEKLPVFVETGTMVGSIMEILGTDPEKMRAFTNAMHDKALKAAWALAREIPVGEARNMLDAGGGPGTYSLEWGKLHPHLKATVFDIPQVLNVTREYIKRYGMEDRVSTLPGDLAKDDPGEGYDLVLLANILHMYGADWSRNILARMTRALSPGGRIVIHGFCTNEDDTGPLNDAVFNLNIGLLTENGRAHPVREKIRWLEDLGCRDIRHFRVDATPTGVLTAVQP